ITIHISFTLVLFFFSFYVYHLVFHSFPTRRSSDLFGHVNLCASWLCSSVWLEVGNASDCETDSIDNISSIEPVSQSDAPPTSNQDRKSTRLNSSHRTISYAVFCLKKKKKQINTLLP